MSRSSMSNRAALGAAAVGAAGVAGRQILRRRRETDLRGKVVLITGASRGLGLAMSREFASRGARLVLCARNEDGLELAREELVALGADVLARPCDIRDFEQVKHLVDESTARFGRVDVVVNNAGVMIVGPIQNQTLADFHEAMDVMFWGGVHTVKAVLPQMLERREGRIVNITSIGGKVSAPHVLPYSSAKFAFVGFSEGLRAELAKEGVFVVTVVPGFMRTGSHLNALFKGKHRAEFAWFSLGAALPVTSINADRAAQRIVEATRRGEPEIILTPQAQIAARFNGLFPGITTDLLSVMGRVLPSADGVGGQGRLGVDSRSPVVSFLTSLGERAAERYRQFVDTPGGEHQQFVRLDGG